MKLNEIQKQLKAPKGQINSFGNYKYRSCEDILEAVKPLLWDSILTLSDDIVEIGGRVYVKATATFTQDDNQTVVTAFARESETKKGMDDSQITGTASSYARKYVLNGLFLIDDTKDADTNEHAKQQETAVEQEPEKEWINKAQIDVLIEKLKTGELVAGSQKDAVKLARQYYKVSNANADIIESLYSEHII